jgi:hypothetical protein
MHAMTHVDKYAQKAYLFCGFPQIGESSMLISFKPRIRFPFDWERGVGMIQYFLDRVDGRYNYMSILKFAFFADRYHVRNHARPVSFDDYYAFRYGPAGSKLKNLLTEDDDAFGFERPFKQDGYNVQLLNKNIDIDQFSKSDIRACEFALEEFRDISKSQFDFSELTHAYPEWAQYERLFMEGLTAREDIDYPDFLNEPTPDNPIFKKFGFVDPFRKIEEEERKTLVEEMRDNASRMV